jgi:hypothetical protein
MREQRKAHSKRKRFAMPKKSYRDTLRANDAAQRMYANLAGKPVKEEWLNNVPLSKKRTAPVHRDGRRPLEKDIQKDIISMLRVHPKVALVEAHNSGAAYMTGRNGEEFPMWFNHIYMKGLRMPDVHATLKGGARRFVIECKRPPFKGPRDEREREQAAYLKVINEAGGIGIFATSVDDVLNVLEDA